MKAQQVENYGKLIALRVHYQNGCEAEYGITMSGSSVFEVYGLSKKCDYGDGLTTIPPVLDERNIREGLGGVLKRLTFSLSQFFFVQSKFACHIHACPLIKAGGSC